MTGEERSDLCAELHDFVQLYAPIVDKRSWMKLVLQPFRDCGTSESNAGERCHQRARRSPSASRPLDVAFLSCGETTRQGRTLHAAARQNCKGLHSLSVEVGFMLMLHEDGRAA